MLTNEELASAVETCDWSGSPIGNKAILTLACARLRETPTPLDKNRVEEFLRKKYVIRNNRGIDYLEATVDDLVKELTHWLF